MSDDTEINVYSKNRQAVLCDYRNRKVLLFPSLSQCALYLELSMNRVLPACKNGGFVNGRCEVAYLDDLVDGQRQWKYSVRFNSIDDFKALPLKIQSDKRVAIHDVKDNKTIVLFVSTDVLLYFPEMGKVYSRELYTELFRKKKRLFRSRFLISCVDEMAQLIEDYKANPEKFKPNKDDQDYAGYVKVQDLETGQVDEFGYRNLYTLSKKLNVPIADYPTFERELVCDGTTNIPGKKVMIT